MLQVSDLSFAYDLISGGSLPVLNNVSFNAKPESYISIVGPSGCGKTTLLLCLSGLFDVDKKNVILGHLSPNEARQQHKIGVVFQKPVFFEWLTILENITLPANISGMDGASYEAFLFLKRFGLDAFAKSYPHELSGGMLSRVALARALIYKPRYLFLDEAFNYLDEALREEINLDIQKLWLDRKITIVSITHSVEEAVFMSDNILVMSQKPSSITLSYQIPFERPREPSLRRSDCFVQLVENIRYALKSIRGGDQDEQA